ncbi:transcriptional regulator, AraC family [Nocardia nova SH22a]|uniref:Transcriptional regulator, AraC family n=1 Tax=Nocardia nova SH22a TaxID=1415166 RepID=W5TLW6_9NOCA|nr:AraC family transcriptional regulator [Nocardia nova]AHH19943.1 transcriptional regulator, AraC family [Nocardia nova SH22a]
MVHWNTPRSAMGALLMAELGRENGLTTHACLRGSGLTQAQLSDPSAVVYASDELAVVANLVRELGDPPGLGVTAGTRFRLTSYGLWGFALVSSPTLRSAIRVGFQFGELSFSLSETSARSMNGEFQLLLEPLAIPPQLRRFTIERDAAGIQTLHRDLLATPTALTRVSFTFPAPAADEISLYEEVFGMRPEFDAEENVLAFDERLADAPLPQANEQTAAIALEHCRDLLDRRRARTGTAGQVRDLLLERLNEPPDAAAIADSLHMSERTLRHHLAQEGTSYRALLDEIRERLAEEMLVAQGLPVAEIAHRLGYVEVSSFSQAFRRWKGMGPRAFRQLQPATVNA